MFVVEETGTGTGVEVPEEDFDEALELGFGFDWGGAVTAGGGGFNPATNITGASCASSSSGYEFIVAP